MEPQKETLVLRLMTLGVFQPKDRATLRTMSTNTLQELIRTAKPPTRSFHTSVSDDRLSIINGLIDSGHFTSADQNALWLMSVETLQALSNNLSAQAVRTDDPIANQMQPPSLGDLVRNRRH